MSVISASSFVNPIVPQSEKYNIVNINLTHSSNTKSRKSHGSTAVSRRKVVFFNVTWEEGLVTFVRNKRNCCVILANFINCRSINNTVSLKNFIILTL